MSNATDSEIDRLHRECARLREWGGRMQDEMEHQAQLVMEKNDEIRKLREEIAAGVSRRPEGHGPASTNCSK